MAGSLTLAGREVWLDDDVDGVEEANGGASGCSCLSATLFRCLRVPDRLLNNID